MKFEDVRVGDVFEYEGQRLVTSYKGKVSLCQVERLCFIWRDGFTQWYEPWEWRELMQNFVKLISRNKTVTVSVSNE